MFSGMFSFVKKAINLPNFARNNRVYGSYLSRYCIVSSPIYDKDDFAKKCPIADFYVTGSDQVWNSKHNEGFNDRYYFAQLPEEAVRISFASSIEICWFSSSTVSTTTFVLKTPISIDDSSKIASTFVTSLSLICFSLYS